MISSSLTLHNCDPISQINPKILKKQDILFKPIYFEISFSTNHLIHYFPINNLFFL